MSDIFGLDALNQPGAIEKTFDTKAALTGLYLWLLFGFLSTMVSCDIQRWMRDSLMFRHFVGIIAFFFLFTVIDTSNKTHILLIWLKTIFIYGMFLLMVKSKWYYSLPLLLLLVLDQSFRVHRDYLDSRGADRRVLEKWDHTREIINKVVIGLIVVGFVHYAVRQKAEFGSNFDFGKLLFSYGCKNL